MGKGKVDDQLNPWQQKRHLACPGTCILKQLRALIVLRGVACRAGGRCPCDRWKYGLLYSSWRGEFMGLLSACGLSSDDLSASSSQ